MTSQSGAPPVARANRLRTFALLAAGYSALLSLDTAVGNEVPGSNGEPSVNAASDYLLVNGFDSVHPVAISAGYFSVCALMSDTTIRCWGDNSGGQLGNPSEGYVPIGHAVTVVDDEGFPLTGAVQVAVSNWHTCALMNDGSLKCWGSNFSGQLGLGTVEPSAIHGPTEVPQLVSPGVTVKEIAVGKEHDCALLTSSVVKCWGLNQIEQAGQPNPNAPDMMYVSTAAAVGLGGATPTHIFAGAYHSCVLSSTGTTCWGVNTDGELGRTLPGNALWDLPGLSVPEIVAPETLVSSASANHVCAVMPNLTHECWGRFESGQLGDGTSDYGAFDEGRPTASTVLDDPGFEHLSVAALNSCGIFNGAIWCWGDGSYEQLTAGAPQYSAVPFLTSITSGATDVAIGAGVVCAIVDGIVECWGINDGGVLGRDLRCGIDPDPDACTSPTPQPVHGF